MQLNAADFRWRNDDIGKIVNGRSQANVGPVRETNSVSIRSTTAQVHNHGRGSSKMCLLCRVVFI